MEVASRPEADAGQLSALEERVATIAAELGEAAVGSPHYGVLFVLGMLLFLITFGINLLADRIVRGRRSKR